ncbi:MAG: RagB/SusD family nutrient uptake outer membrane protein [Flavobacteriaceae bacterium]|nr:RagB/SusD family nutrient uptake outer membrane protein [Flavobacteriaceae bacterium]
MIGCGEKLDLVPEDQLTQDIAFSTKELAMGVLTGAYGNAQVSTALNGLPQLMGDFQSDNIDFVGSFPSLNEIKFYTTLSNNAEVGLVWDSAYEIIGTVNLVIANFPLVDDSDFTQEERDNGIAQAKFLRALMHFQLANWWSQPLQVSGGNDPAVPLVLDPFEGIPTFPARASMNEVYAQVEQDLLEAIPFLSDVDRSRATQGAAQGLLARLYLYQERWTEAADLANQVIQNPAFSLAADYSFYNTLSPEFLFTLVNEPTDPQLGLGFSNLANPQPVGRGDAPYSQDLLDAYAQESGDLRFTSLSQMGPDTSGFTKTFTSKYPDGVTNSDNAPVLRITEMYLIRAEANFRGSTTTGDMPLNDINTLRSRAGLPPLATLDLDTILNERRKELCFEGHRRMDLLRNNMNLRRPGMPNEADSGPGQPKVILPIPVNELDLNENLVQNPGY